jgi:hypothetical protein
MCFYLIQWLNRMNSVDFVQNVCLKDCQICMHLILIITQTFKKLEYLLSYLRIWMAMVLDSMVLGVCFTCVVYYSCFVSRLLILSRILFLSPIYALSHNKNIWTSFKSCNFRTNKPSEKWTIALLNFRITKSLDNWTIRLYCIRITERKFEDTQWVNRRRKDKYSKQN